MTARDEMAVLFERAVFGEDPDDPDTDRYHAAVRQAASELDELASLATDPETAPVVFRWLVEAGVLVLPDGDACEYCDTKLVQP